MNNYRIFKNFFFIFLATLLLITNNCYAQIFTSEKYSFSIYVPNDFIYYEKLQEGKIMEAYNPDTLASMNISTYPFKNVDEYGEGITENDKLKYAKNILKQKFTNFGSIVYDEGELPIAPNHKAIYLLHKSQICGKIFDTLTAQFIAHKKIYTISFMQLDGDKRMLEFFMHLKTFKCFYGH